MIKFMFLSYTKIPTYVHDTQKNKRMDKNK